MKRRLKAVFLDMAPLGPDDLDMSVILEAKLPDNIMIDWACYSFTEYDQVPERVAQADIIVTNKVLIDEQVFAAAPGLGLLLVTATGTNNVDLKLAHSRGVVVCHARNYGSGAVAQHTFALLLALCGNLPRYQAAVKRGDWSKSSQFCLTDFPIVELEAKTLGIVGYGDIGKAVAKLGEAFGMKVMVSKSLNPLSNVDHDGKRLDLAAVLKAADVLSLHCTLSDETKHLINADSLAQMKSSAFLINTSRGPLVDSSALADALKQGVIAGAGLDVLSIEPPPAVEPLLDKSIPNLIVTPHMAWASSRARQNLVDQLGESLYAWLHGHDIPRVVS